MKKIIILIIVVPTLILTYWLVSPFWRVEKVSESIPTLNLADNVATTTDPVVLKKGVFTGFDRIHTGSGTAQIIQLGNKKYIRFEQDFKVNNGPDLFVGLGKDGKYIKGSELGELKGAEGSQNYELPEGVDPYEVWVWCKAFSVPFAKAILE